MRNSDCFSAISIRLEKCAESAGNIRECAQSAGDIVTDDKNGNDGS